MICGCTRLHGTPAWFAASTFVGIQPDVPGYPWLLLRTCNVCGTTRATEMHGAPARAS